MAGLHKVLFILAVLLLALAVDGDNYFISETMDNNNGEWELVNQNSGVSAMHVNLLPNNKIYVYDAVAYHVSRLNLPAGTPCLVFKDLKTGLDAQDCFAHSMEYDIHTNQVRPLKVLYDPWCSSGGLAPDGTLISVGGFDKGVLGVRYINDCADCDWRDNMNIMKDPRWYATQVILPNGEFIAVGGRRAFSYEFVPKEGQVSQKSYFFPFLYETSDPDENNLYPFVHLSTDGNLFIFSNNRSLLLNPTNHKIVRTFPVLPGGSRNYPASGMSALLPIKLKARKPLRTLFNFHNDDSTLIPAEVIVCGGNVHNAFQYAEKQKIFLPALQDCNRLKITESYPKWETEDMPSRRTMGDLLILPNGELLFINGAQNGTAAWWDAEVPNFTPVLYKPEKRNGKRFRELKPTTIARMYHSSSAVLPNGKIWVSGSNPHLTYVDEDRYPTETRVEHFSPPYLDVGLDNFRPRIIEKSSDSLLRYQLSFETAFSFKDKTLRMALDDIEVTVYPPPFTTHGYSMGQRLVVLGSVSLNVGEGGETYTVKSVAPPSANIAPPGHYLLFVVYRGLPSHGMWVQITE